MVRFLSCWRRRSEAPLPPPTHAAERDQSAINSIGTRHTPGAQAPTRRQQLGRRATVVLNEGFEPPVVVLDATTAYAMTLDALTEGMCLFQSRAPGFEDRVQLHLLRDAPAVAERLASSGDVRAVGLVRALFGTPSFICCPAVPQRSCVPPRLSFYEVVSVPRCTLPCEYGPALLRMSWKVMKFCG